ELRTLEPHRVVQYVLGDALGPRRRLERPRLADRHEVGIVLPEVLRHVGLAEARLEALDEPGIRGRRRLRPAPGPREPRHDVFPVLRGRVEEVDLLPGDALLERP